MNALLQTRSVCVNPYAISRTETDNHSQTNGVVDGLRDIKDLLAREKQDEKNNNLQQPLAEKHAPHVTGNQRFLFVVNGLAREHFVIGRFVGGKSQGSKPIIPILGIFDRLTFGFKRTPNYLRIHDQVDPEQLNCSKHRLGLAARNGRYKSDNHGRDVDGKLEHQEFADTVRNGSTPH